MGLFFAIAVIYFSIETDQPTDVQPLKISHLQWLGSDLLIFTTLDITGSTNCLRVGKINDTTKNISIIKSLELDLYAIGISVNQETGTVVLQLKDGSLHKYLEGE